MALVKCKECGNEVNSEAKACPKCGASIQAKSAGCGTVILVVVVVLVLIVFFSPEGSKVPERHLTATVRSLGAFFVIQNNDTFAWGNCDLDLNSDYTVKGVNISATDELRVPARDFATKDGNRFNLIAMKPQTLYIYCRQTPHGTLSTMVGWK